MWMFVSFKKVKKNKGSKREKFQQQKPDEKRRNLSINGAIVMTDSVPSKISSIFILLCKLKWDSPDDVAYSK